MLTLNCQIESDKDSDFWLAQQRQDKAAAGSSAVATLTRWVPFNLTLKICKDGMLEVLQDVKPGKPSPTSTLASSTSGSDQSMTTPDVSPMTTGTTTSSSEQSQGGEGKEVEESLPESDDAVIVGGDKEEEEEPLPLTAIEGGDGGGKAGGEKAGGETVTAIEGRDGAGGETEDVKEGEEEGKEGMAEQGQGTGSVKEEMEGGEITGKCDGSGEEKLAESEGEVSDGGGDGEGRVDLEAEWYVTCMSLGWRLLAT